MPSLLADHNCDGHIERMVLAWKLDRLLEIWIDLAWNAERFGDVGLDDKTPDDAVWRFCQENEYVLLTNNRNCDGDDSLEATIRRCNKNDSLPVITIGDGERFMHDWDYTIRAARKAIDYLFDIDNLRGTGRLYVP